MVEIKFSSDFTPEFMSLVPEQRAYANEAMQKNIISSYTLCLERGKLWTIINKDTEEKVAKEIEKFPMADYFTYDMFALTFNNQVMALPHISLN